MKTFVLAVLALLALGCHRDGTVTLNGVISGTGSLNKQGAGTFILGGANTYSGTTTINAGTLQVGSGTSGVLGATSATVGTAAVTDNATLAFYRNDATVINPVGVISGTGSVTYSGPATLTSTFGQYTVDDLNSYSGGTTISTCRVSPQTNTAFGTGAITVTSGGQIYAATSTSTPLLITNPVTINGTGWLESAGNLGALRLASGTVMSGTITLGSNSRISSYGSTGTLSGAITGTGNLEFTAQNQYDTIVLSGASANTYTGTTTITSGEIVLSKSGGALTIPGDLVMDNAASPMCWPAYSNAVTGTNTLTFTTASGNARFDLVGTTQTFRGITAGSANAVIQNSEAIGSGVNTSPLNYDTGSLILNVPGAESYTYLNAYLRGQNGTLALIKNGTGNQTLGGANITHNGTTTINAGTLTLQDATAFVSPTTLNSSGTLVLNRTTAGFANRSKTEGLITGNGTININCTTSGLAGGWVSFNATTAGLYNFTGTINVNSGVLSLDNQAGAWSGNPNVNVTTGNVFAIRAQDISINSLTGGGDVGTGLGSLPVGRF